MERAEIVRNIETKVEKILEDFIEVLQYLRASDCDESDELQNLLFANRRMIELVDSSLEIYHYLIKLKYSTNHVHKPTTNRNVSLGFDQLFEEMASRMG